MRVVHKKCNKKITSSSGIYKTRYDSGSYLLLFEKRKWQSLQISFELFLLLWNRRCPPILAISSSTHYLLPYSLFLLIFAISSNTLYFLQYSLNIKAYKLNKHLIGGNTLRILRIKEGGPLA